MKTRKFLAAAILTLALGFTSFAQKTVMVGGAAMYPNKNIIENAVNSKDHTTLVAAVKAADLVETLQGKGPFTVFAPTNGAFTAFETANPGVLASLTPNQVTSVLTYHVVAGANVLSNGIPTTPITTLETGTFTVAGTVITDEQLRTTNIVVVDVQCSNGVIHAVDNVLLPTL